MVWRPNCAAIVILAAIISPLAHCCQDDNCLDCDTFITTGGNLGQTCNGCMQGYIFGNDGKCVQDKGLIIGIAIGAFAAIVAQIICYCYCKIKFGSPKKKKSEINLNEIYHIDETVQSNEGDKSKQGNKNGTNINVRQQNQDSLSDSIQSEFKLFIRRECGICGGQKTSIKTLCSHYFHHDCFQKKMKETSAICPYTQCGKRTLSPIEMMCIKCLNKKRQVPLESYSNFDNFKDFICIVCRLKIRRDEEKKKWWKNIFKINQ